MTNIITIADMTATLLATIEGLRQVMDDYKDCSPDNNKKLAVLDQLSEDCAELAIQRAEELNNFVLEQVP